MNEDLLERYLRGTPLSPEDQRSLAEMLETEEGGRAFAESLTEWALLASVSGKLADADRVYRGTPSRSRLRSPELPRVRGLLRLGSASSG
ncbi:MAG TPA: hypothetical protein VKW04_00700, partial [Planctomycetota bacterium]|nr:hypothetical protein [Planctomycetota bacterium]